MMTKISTKDWRNLPIEKWNANTFHAYLIEGTKERFNADYTPGGKGSKSQRWNAEKGMLKREFTAKGPELVRKFIEVCWREYFTPNAKEYPYPNFGFMLGYMDRYWNVAQAELAEEQRRVETEQQAQAFDASDYEDWL